MTEKKMFIPARLKSSVVGGHVAGAEDILDDAKGMTQAEINDSVDNSLEDINRAINSISNKASEDKQGLQDQIDIIKGGSSKSIQELEDELATKQTQLTFDNAPEAGSQNPVKSSGIKNALDTKVDKIAGKGLSTEDYTTAEKDKLANLPTGAAIALALNQKQDTLEFDNTPTSGSTKMVRSGAVRSYVDAETQRAKSAEEANAGSINDINQKIPAEASKDNQLADKAFVNSSVATNTANYVSNGGEPFSSFEALQAYTGILTNNDYAFVKGADSSGNTLFKRYKYSAATKSWALEYELNNSSFTQAQWTAINSGITELLKNKLADLPTVEELNDLLEKKQETVADLEEIRSGAASGATAYQKPAGGIPLEDMTETVKESLSKADSALQQHQPLEGYATEQWVLDKNYLTEHQDISGKADKDTTYTKQEVDDALSQKQDNITIDSTPTVNSNNPISSDAVYDLEKQLKELLDGKQSKLTFDLAPTAGSGNPVTSAGIFSALAESKQIEFVDVDELPEPNGSTMGKVYILTVEGGYTWHVTVFDAAAEPPVYKWKQVNTASVDLTPYYTGEKVDEELAKKQDNLTFASLDECNSAATELT